MEEHNKPDAADGKPPLIRGVLRRNMKFLLICDDTNPKEVIELCRKSGSGIEIQGFYRPEALVDSDLVEKTIDLTNKITPKCLHGPFGDLCPGSFDSEVRHLARKRFEQAWSVSKRLDATHIVFHHGYVPNTSFPSGWLKRWPKFWKAFLQDKDSSIRIHIENHLDTEPNLISDAVALVENDILDINLDIGHVNFASNIPILKWIEKLRCQIGYIHFHDNHGETDEHLGLGQGTIPMSEVCIALEEYAPNAIWAIEAEGKGIMQSLVWLHKHGFIKGINP